MYILTHIDKENTTYIIERIDYGDESWLLGKLLAELDCFGEIYWCGTIDTKEVFFNSLNEVNAYIRRKFPNDEIFVSLA